MSVGQQPYLYMAPLKGITDALFRRVYFNHFSGLDGVIAPFINPQSSTNISDKLLADVMVQDRSSVLLIPQILNTDPAGFLALADRLYDLGYDEMNWNLGCPVKMVAGKKRGSGLLPYPDQIIDLLDTVMPRLKPKLSIKMRLGYREPGESYALLPRLDDYPLSEIIIHTRLGVQLYRGNTHPELFNNCLDLTRHRLVYNGDITSRSAYSELAEILPTIDRWMIGRGLLANPFLPGDIKGQPVPDESRAAILGAFHEELFQEMKQRLSGSGHLLGKMKQVWIYLIGAFPGKEKQLKKITRAANEKSFLAAVETVLG